MKSNKKKYMIAAAAFIVCFIMFVFAIKAQRMYANTLTNKQEAAQKAESKSNDTKATEDKTTKEESKSQDNSSKDKKNGNAENAGKAEENKSKSDASSNLTNENSSQANSAVQESSSKNIKVKEEDPNSQMTFQIIDTVHGNKMILQKDISSMEGEPVGYITTKILDEGKIKYKATGSASTIYFAAIDGLEEKKAGTLSGWCYYVKKKGDTRFHKPNVGSGQWIYHSGDVVIWKYLADGIHDGYEDDWGKSDF